jgi:hypothetical protein
LLFEDQPPVNVTNIITKVVLLGGGAQSYEFEQEFNRTNVAIREELATVYIYDHAKQEAETRNRMVT